MANKFTFAQFKSKYPNDDACLDAIMQRHYGDKPICPGCGVINTTFHRITKRRGYACAQCGHHVFPCAGTIFEHSSTPLSLWFHAMYLLTATRNGVSAKELQRQLGVTYKCAWRIGHQLRILMAARAKAQHPGQLSGHVEADQTYIGGRRRGAVGKRAALENKTIVFGAVERGGPIQTQVIPNETIKTMVPVFQKMIEKGSVLSTDKHRSHLKLAAYGFDHGMVDHNAEEYVRGIHHTQTIEGFWKHLKCAIKSTHISVSPQHTQKYLGEFTFRFDNRHAPADMFNRMLKQISKPSA